MEDEMRVCATCGGPFGMIRFYVYRIIGGSLQFCSRFCRDQYQAERDRKKREEKWRKFLDIFP